MPKDGASQGRQVYHCGVCGRRTALDAAYQRPSAADQERALAMYQEGSSMSAIARIFGVSVQAVSQRVKGGPAALSRMRRQGEKRTAGVGSSRLAVVIAGDEMWAYRQARQRGKRQDVWVWTAGGSRGGRQSVGRF